MLMRQLIVHAVFAGIMAVIAKPARAVADDGTKVRADSASPETHHPRNWRFTMPKGDIAKGRAVFEKFECYYCHRINGESFPEPTEDGPELSQMGPLHPVEFFTESIINPSAVAGKKDRDSDGKSYMSVAHLKQMTLQELIDISSYIGSLRPPLAAQEISGVGKVVAIVAGSQELIIDHDEIKGVMDAMTMGYKVSKVSLLKNVKVGDKVRFTIDSAGREITKLEKLKN